MNKAGEAKDLERRLTESEVSANRAKVLQVLTFYPSKPSNIYPRH